MAYELLLEDPKKKKYEVLPDQSDSFVDKLGTGIASTGLRALETVAGTPGNILSAGFGGLNYLTSGAVPSYEQIQEKLPPILPTTAQLRASTKKLSGEKFEPKSPLEQKYQSGIETVTSLMTPLGPLGKGLKFGKALKGAIGGELLQGAAEKLGFGGTVQGIAKTLGVLGGTLGFNTRQLMKTYEKNYDEFGKIAQGRKINAKPLEKGIEELRSKWVEQGDSQAKAFARERLNVVDSIIQEGKVDAGKLWRLKKDLNTHYPNASDTEISFIKELRDLEKNALREIGPQYNLLESADDIYTSLKESDRTLRLIHKSLPKVPISSLLKGLFGVGAYFKQVPVAAGLYGAGKITSEGKKIWKFLNTDTGWKYYSQILKDSAAGNTANLSKDLAKLNEAAFEFEKVKDKPVYEIID